MAERIREAKSPNDSDVKQPIINCRMGGNTHSTSMILPIGDRDIPDRHLPGGSLIQCEMDHFVFIKKHRDDGGPLSSNGSVRGMGIYNKGSLVRQTLLPLIHQVLYRCGDPSAEMNKGV